MLESVVNKNGWLWLAPEYFNRWRIFPRAFIMFYFWLAFETAMWFMGLPAPGASQSAFASAVMGAGAAWFGLYVNSGNQSVRSVPMPTSSNVQIPQPPIQTVNISPGGRSRPPESEAADDVPTYQVKGE